MEVYQAKKNTRVWNDLSHLSARQTKSGVRLCWDRASEAQVKHFLVYRNGRRIRTVSGETQWCQVRQDGAYTVAAKTDSGETEVCPSTLEMNLTEGYYFGEIQFYHNQLPVSQLPSGMVEVGVRVGNLGPSPLSVVFVAAMYQNGSLIGCESISEAIEREMKELRIKLEIEHPLCTVLQVFLWNGMKPDSPIFESRVLSKSAETEGGKAGGRRPYFL